MNNRLHIKSGRSRFAIKLDEIIYMEKYGRKIELYTICDEHAFYAKFVDVMLELDERFITPHESYLINMDHIIKIDGNGVLMSNEVQICFGRKSISKAKKKYDEYVDKLRGR